MSALAEQHQKWTEAKAKLWDAPAPPAKPTQIKRLSPFTREILERSHEARAYFDAQMVRGPTIEVMAHYPFGRFQEPTLLQPKSPIGLWKTITKEVAEKHRVTVTDILSLRRDRKTIAARHEAWERIRRETTLSLSEIGRRFNRDHTTIIAGIRSHERRRAQADK